MNIHKRLNDICQTLTSSLGGMEEKLEINTSNGNERDQEEQEEWLASLSVP